MPPLALGPNRQQDHAARQQDELDEKNGRRRCVNAGSSVPRVRGYWAKRRPFHSPSDSGRGSARQTGETSIQT